jgi:hypothetical protein
VQPFSVIIGIEKRSLDDSIARPFFLYLTQVEQKESRQEESLFANLPHPCTIAQNWNIFQFWLIGRKPTGFKGRHGWSTVTYRIGKAKECKTSFYAPEAQFMVV